MSNTKYESQDESRKQLQLYDDLVKEYGKEFRCLSPKLHYTEKNSQSSLISLLQMLTRLGELGLELEQMPSSDSYFINQAKMKLIISNFALQARMKQSLILLDRCVILKLSVESPEPTFEALQKDLVTSLDALITYKESLFYVNQATKTLVQLTIQDHQQEELKELLAPIAMDTLTLANTLETRFIQRLSGISFDERKLHVDYVKILKTIEAFLPFLNYKTDESFQLELYTTLRQAEHQLVRDNKEKALIEKYPSLMADFIKNCSDNVVKLCYYKCLVVQETNNVKFNRGFGGQVRDNTAYFFELYRKVRMNCEKLQQDHALDSLQKAYFIKANLYAFYVRSQTQPSLQGNSITQALDEAKICDKGRAYAKKYIVEMIKLRDEYFSKGTEIFLSQDLQDIVTDSQAIVEYLDLTYRICTEATNQICYIQQLWYALEGLQEASTKVMLYNEACTYKSICAHYYTCYNLLNNYLTQGDGVVRLVPEFDKDIQEMEDLFVDFKTKYDLWLKADKENEVIALQLAKTNEDSLLKLNAKAPKKPRAPKREVKTTPVQTPKTQKNPQPLKVFKQVQDEIDQALEYGLECINQKNHKGALSHYWKAYNLATNKGQTLQKLYAMDGLCHLAGLELTKQLAVVEGLAKTKSPDFHKEALSLLDQLPKLKNTYDHYFEFIEVKKSHLTKDEKKAIAFSRDTFGKQFIHVKSKIKTLLEQQAKQSKANTSQNDTKAHETLRFTLDRHLDNLVSERTHTPLHRQAVGKALQIKIMLPQNLQLVFEFLAQFKGKHYLVGSKVLQLALNAFNQPTILVQDADFISTHTNRANLIIAGFQENYYMRNLYSLYHKFEWPLDLVALPEVDNWLMNSLLSRDFTIAALSCDKEGFITDPTGQGFEDIRQRRLVMIGCPKTRLQQDPVLVLRALKYMVFGFKPDEALHNALESWQPSLETNFSKLFAVTRKHLSKAEEGAHFLALLCRYNLLQKIFGVQEKAQLWPLLGLTTPSTQALTTHGLFNTSSKEACQNHIVTSQINTF